MSTSSGKFRKRYLYCPNYRYQLTCLIHGTGNSSYYCKVLGDFGSKYSKIRRTKGHRQEPVFKKKFGKHQKNNAIVQHALNEITLKKKYKLSVKDKTHENIDDKVNEDELYEIKKMSLDKNNVVSMRLKVNSKIYMI